LSKARISYRHLAWLFVKMGSSTFGGWSAAAVILERELVLRRRLLTSAHLQGAVAYAQILPGATQVSLVASAGYRLRGVKGACVATLSYLLPATALVLIFAVVYFRYLRESPQLLGQLDGLLAALCGVILANAYRIGSRHASRAWLWWLAGMVLVARLWLGINPLLAIVTFGAGGILIAFVTAPAHKGRRAAVAAIAPVSSEDELGKS
jgi:chromate transporter